MSAAPGSSSASRHGSRAGSSKSLCPAGIKLSSFSACWPRLAEGSGRHHGLSRGPDWPAQTQGDLPARSSPWLSPAQTEAPFEGPTATGTPGMGPHARRHRGPGTYGCCGPGHHLPDHRDAQLASGLPRTRPGRRARLALRWDAWTLAPAHRSDRKPRSARPAGASHYRRTRADRRLASVLISRSVMLVSGRAVHLADGQSGGRDAGRLFSYRAAPARKAATI